VEDVEACPAAALGLTGARLLGDRGGGEAEADRRSSRPAVLPARVEVNLLIREPAVLAVPDARAHDRRMTAQEVVRRRPPVPHAGSGCSLTETAALFHA
jgi:hypothetical protein